MGVNRAFDQKSIISAVPYVNFKQTVTAVSFIKIEIYLRRKQTSHSKRLSIKILFVLLCLTELYQR